MLHIDTSDRVATKNLTEPEHNDGAPFVLFKARHNTIMKAYTAEITIAKKRPYGYETLHHLYGENPQTVTYPREPVARYSAKRFEAFVGEALAALEKRAPELIAQLGDDSPALVDMVADA